MGLKPNLAGLAPVAAMVAVMFFIVGQATLTKAALSKGISSFVFVAYSNALATLILLPPSFLFQRTTRPPLSFLLLCKFFLMSLCLFTVMQNCIAVGISYSSPTLSTAMSNLIPAFTFLLAVIFRIEKVDLRKSTSQVKIMGSLVSISGALIVTLYEGPAIGSLLVLSLSVSAQDSFPSQPSHFDMLATESTWLLGAVFLAIAYLSVSMGFTYQAAILKEYPSELAIVAFCCLFATIQCTAVALFAERNNPSAWKLSLDVEVVAVVYSAVVGTVLTATVQAWCIHKKGPVFAAMFSPVSIAIAVLFSTIFLGDTLHVGSVIGAIVIVVGFYGVTWAQSREEKKQSHGFDQPPSPPSNTTPLLQTHTVV